MADNQTEKPSFMARVLRRGRGVDAESLKVLADALKAAPMQFTALSRGGASSAVVVDDRFLVNTYSRTASRSIDYAEEVGDLTLSSLVMAAVSWAGRTLPEAPLRVVKETAGGVEEAVVGHALVGRLRRPNNFFSGSTLWKSFALSWILSGNAYFYKIRSLRGEVIELWWLPHWMVRPVRETVTDFISSYEYTVNGRAVRLDADDVVHFKDGSDPHNEMLGISPVASVLRELYTDQQAAHFSAHIMKHVGVVPFVVAPKPGVEDVDTDRIKAEIMRRITGDEVGKPLVLTSGVDIIKLSLTPAELNLDAMRRVPAERMCAVIGIPAMALGFQYDRATFSNYEQAVASAYESFLIPLWRYIAEELSHQLLPDFGGEGGAARVDHDLSKVRALQEDEDALYRRVVPAWTAGLIKRGEARAKLGFASGPEDDVYFSAGAGADGAAEDDGGVTP